MRLTVRAVLVFLGLGLIFGCFVLSAHQQAPGYRLNAVLALAVALTLFGAMLRTAERLPVPLAALAAGFFLFNPLTFTYTLWAPQAACLRDALIVLLFCGFWLSSEHWSIFMRSLLLAGAYMVALWTGSAAAFWIPVALVPWVVFNRRPATAAASSAVIVLVALGAYGALWLIADRLTFLSKWQMQPFFKALSEQGQSWIFERNPRLFTRKFAGYIGMRLVSAAWFFTLPLVLAAGWSIQSRLRLVLRERRSDARSFMGFLALTIGAGWLACLFGSPVFHDGDLITVVAVCIPLWVWRLDTGDLLLSRSARRAAVLSLFIGILTVFAAGYRQMRGNPVASWTGLLLLSVALVVGFFGSRLEPGGHKIGGRLRAAAVLTGIYPGICAAFIFFFLRP